MVTTGLTWLSISVALFIFLMWAVAVERKRGKRFLFTRVRAWSDKHVAAIGLRITLAWDHFTKYFLQLSWYYTVHSFLQAILKAIVAFYERIEHTFEVNRSRTKQLRAEKSQVTTQNHLTEMTKHKIDTALTPAQKRKLRDKQLRGD